MSMSSQRSPMKDISLLESSTENGCVSTGELLHLILSLEHLKLDVFRSFHWLLG